MRHHYVPRFYLQLFVDPAVPIIETDYLWEVHLPSATIKRRAPKNVAARPDYYKIPGVPPDVAQTVEENFSKIESVCAPILRRLAAGDLTFVDQDRAEILFFMAFLAIRVPTFRNRIEDFYEEVGRKMMMMSASQPEHFKATLRKVLEEKGEPMPSDEEVERHRKWALDPEKYTITANPGLSLMHGFQLATETIYPIFSRMRWAFLRAPKGVAFITSDCPVSWYDPTPRPAAYGGHGLGMRNVEVTFPVTPSVALLGTHEGPKDVQDAELGQVLLFNLRKLYWAEEHAYAASSDSADQALALAIFGARQARQQRPEPSSA